jgi:cold shock CspA family protein
MRRTGTVKFFCPDRHYGFLWDSADGTETFFHGGCIVGDDLPLPGMPLSYERGVDRDRPCAKFVRLDE